MLKPSLFMIFSALFFCASISQAKDIERSTIEVSGDIGLSVASIESTASGVPTTSTDTKDASLDAVSYFQKNIGVGLSLRYNSTESESAGVQTELQTNTVGPIISYNLSVGEKTSIKLKATALYSWGSQYDSTIGTTVVDGLGLRLGGQLSYFINERVSLNVGLSYINLNLKDDVSGIDVNTKGLGIGTGISVYLGN